MSLVGMVDSDVTLSAIAFLHRPHVATLVLSYLYGFSPCKLFYTLTVNWTVCQQMGITHLIGVWNGICKCDPCVGIELYQIYRV